MYDYLGRRVEKKVSTHNGTSWSVDDRRRFVWSDWLPLLELDASDPNDVTILRKYTWGLDLSGNSIDGAGGIGGLLATEDVADTKDYYYLYDASGNVGQVLDASDGSINAKYEYDPYGNNLLDPNDPNESGPYAADNPFRFSTKYWDDETALGYWGFRYYSPRLGRWLSRDPIAERGGRNLYVFAHNRSVNVVDSYGLVCGPWMPTGDPVFPTRKRFRVTGYARYRGLPKKGPLGGIFYDYENVWKDTTADFEIAVATKVVFKFIGRGTDGQGADSEMFVGEWRGWRRPTANQLMVGTYTQDGKPVRMAGTGCRITERCARTCRRCCCEYDRRTGLTRQWDETKCIFRADPPRKWTLDWRGSQYRYGRVGFAPWSGQYVCVLAPTGAAIVDQGGQIIAIQPRKLSCSEGDVPRCGRGKVEDCDKVY